MVIARRCSEIVIDDGYGFAAWDILVAETNEDIVIECSMFNVILPMMMSIIHSYITIVEVHC